MATFIEQYRRQIHGNQIHLCNIAFFPVCTSSHWFLFVVDIDNFKLTMIDPMRDEKPTSGRDIYPVEFYVMEKFLPYMLHKLDSDRFPANKYLRVKERQSCPKQEGGVDCGIFVCKYMDAILILMPCTHNAIDRTEPYGCIKVVTQSRSLLGNWDASL